MDGRSIQFQPERGNFDHTGCYRDGLHENSRKGRQWYRRQGPASKFGRVYSTSAKRTISTPPVTTYLRRDSVPFDHAARARRASAAQRYQPENIELLLVAEAPSAALDRYFYFPDVQTQDSLFRYVTRSILNVEPIRATKLELLQPTQGERRLSDRPQEDPVVGTPLTDFVPELVQRARRLNPEKIILIKNGVYNAAYGALHAAGAACRRRAGPIPGQWTTEAVRGSILARLAHIAVDAGEGTSMITRS